MKPVGQKRPRGIHRFMSSHTARNVHHVHRARTLALPHPRRGLRTGPQSTAELTAYGLRLVAEHPLPVLPARLERVSLARKHTPRERRARAAREPLLDRFGSGQRRQRGVALGDDLRGDCVLVGVGERGLHHAPHLPHKEGGRR